MLPGDNDQKEQGLFLFWLPMGTNLNHYTVQYIFKSCLFNCLFQSKEVTSEKHFSLYAYSICSSSVFQMFLS